MPSERPVEQGIPLQEGRKWSNLQVKQLILQKAGPLSPWEKEYLDFHTARFTDTLKLLGTGSGKRLLDVGAFPGHLTLAVQALGFEVQALTGTMESARGLELFTQRLASHQIPLVLADVEEESFPFPDQSFDVVLAAEIIEHLPFNPYHLLREAFRVLKPGGRIILTTPNISKLDNLLNLAVGRTIHPDIRLPLHKNFKSILIGRHIREYTADELIYMLEGQNKEMYRYEGSQVSYTMCLDPAFSWSGAFPWIIKKLWPRFRATLFIQSYRPHHLELLPPEEITNQGFYEVEKHPAHMGSTGRILATPFRWTQHRTEIDLPSSGAPYQVFLLHLIFLAPRYLPIARMEIKVGKGHLGDIGLLPGREYVPVSLVLPAYLADEGFFKLSLECPTWRPADHAAGLDYYEYSIADTRDLGIALAWDGLLRLECPNPEALRKIAQKECGRSPLRAGNDGRWSPLSGLYLIRTNMKSALTMGPGDWPQLGLGWHHLERWKQGWMRWSSQKSESFLEPEKPSGRLGIRVFTGDPFLGSGVEGSIEIQWAADRLIFFPLAEQPFSLPSATWTDLKIDLPVTLNPGGVLRVIIRVKPVRIPADLMADSNDGRELGLAVFSLTLKE